jgi:hypothetical protein
MDVPDVVATSHNLAQAGTLKGLCAGFEAI